VFACSIFGLALKAFGCERRLSSAWPVVVVVAALAQLDLEVSERSIVGFLSGGTLAPVALPVARFDTDE
jgi:hypothetical protein